MPKSKTVYDVCPIVDEGNGLAVEIDGEYVCLSASEKAALFKIRYPGAAQTFDVWVPTSQIVLENHGVKTVATVPKWLASKLRI